MKKQLMALGLGLMLTTTSALAQGGRLGEFTKKDKNAQSQDGNVEKKGLRDLMRKDEADPNFRQPAPVYSSLKASPEAQEVFNILSSHRTWVRNNVRVGGDYVADKATVQVDPGQNAMVMALWVNETQAGQRPSPVCESRALLLWSWNHVDTEWGRAYARESASKGNVIVNEGEKQWRFPMATRPGGVFQDVRLVSYKGKMLLYVMKPGTDVYLEEWILQ